MTPSLTLRGRRPPPAGGEVTDADLEDLPPIATSRQQVGSTLTTRLSTAVLVSCLIAGPAGVAVGVLALASSASTAAPATAKVADLSGQRAAAQEFAQRVVMTWLTTSRGQEAQLTALIPASANVSFPQEPFAVSNVDVAGITEIEGAWAVTVAATVTDQRKVTARRFFQVPVTVRAGDGAVSALALPSPVAGPVVSGSGDLNYQVQVPGTGPVTQTIGAFLASYLTGSGDVTRYLTPGVQIQAVTPALFTAVAVTDTRAITSAAGLDTTGVPKDGTVLRVLVAAVGTVSETQQITTSYALTMTARAGRWEISAVDPAPARAPQTPAVTSTSGQTSLPAIPGPSATSSAPTPPAASITS